MIRIHLAILIGKKQPVALDIDEGSKRLDQIVDEVERIELVGMMNSQCGIQSSANDGSCHASPEHGVSVIQPRIRPFAVA